MNEEERVLDLRQELRLQEVEKSSCSDEESADDESSRNSSEHNSKLQPFRPFMNLH